MWPRVSSGEFARGKGSGNRRAFRRLVRSGDPPGLLAYAGRDAVGWCALGPREAYRRIENSRTLARVDGQRVWSVICFFVARPYRKRGMTVRLLREAVRYARKRGARILEGYPVEPRSGKTADAFAWTGLAAAFRAAGFVEVARRSPTRPIMRTYLAPARGGRPRGRTGTAAPRARPKQAQAREGRAAPRRRPGQAAVRAAPTHG